MNKIVKVFKIKNIDKYYNFTEKNVLNIMIAGGVISYLNIDKKNNISADEIILYTGAGVVLSPLIAVSLSIYAIHKIIQV